MFVGQQKPVCLISVSVRTFFYDIIILCDLFNELLHRGESCLSDLVSVACLYVAQSIAVSLLVSHTLAQFYRSDGKTSVLRYLSECCSSVRRDNERLSVLVTFLPFGFNTSFFLRLFCLNASLLLFLGTFTLLSGFPFRFRLLGRYALRFRLGGFLSACLLAYDGFPSIDRPLCLRHCRLVFLD